MHNFRAKSVLAGSGLNHQTEPLKQQTKPGKLYAYYIFSLIPLHTVKSATRAHKRTSSAHSVKYERRSRANDNEDASSDRSVDHGMCRKQPNTYVFAVRLLATDSARLVLLSTRAETAKSNIYHPPLPTMLGIYDVTLWCLLLLPIYGGRAPGMSILCKSGLCYLCSMTAVALHWAYKK